MSRAALTAGCFALLLAACRGGGLGDPGQYQVEFFNATDQTVEWVADKRLAPLRLNPRSYGKVDFAYPRASNAPVKLEFADLLGRRVFCVQPTYEELKARYFQVDVTQGRDTCPPP